MLARRATIDLEYEGVMITKDIHQDLLSFTFTDNASGMADDVSIVLKDDKGKWLNDWFPSKGDTIRPVIQVENWRHEGDSRFLTCGSFTIDEPTCSGPPNKINIKGNSMPSNSHFKEVKHTRSWSSVYFSMIVEDIAKGSGLDFEFDSQDNPYIQYVLQEKEGDSKFLMDLCDLYGFGFKVTDRKVVIYNLKDYHEKEALMTIDSSSAHVMTYSLGTSLTDTAYKKVKMRYRDEVSGRLQWYVYALDDQDEGKVFEIEAIADSYTEAEKTSLTKFREENMNEFQVQFSLLGNIDLRAATCVELSGYGQFDGKYFVDKVVHTVGGGYTTNFEARKVVALSEKKEKPLGQATSQASTSQKAPSESFSNLMPW